METCVAWRDDGLFRQLWHLCCTISRRGRLNVSRLTFPPAGFVGRVSGSYRDIAGLRLYLISTQLNRLRRTHGIFRVRLWRLTYEWATHPPALRHLPSGRRWAPAGKRSAAAGVDDSTPQTSTTSIFPGH